MAITFFFPECDIDPVDVRGHVPRRGELVFFRSYDMRDNVFDKIGYSRWRVTEVNYSVTVWNRSLENVMKKNDFRAEVRVVRKPYRFKFYKIRRFFRSLWSKCRG